MRFTVTGPTFSTNMLVKMHWTEKKRLRGQLAWQIVAGAIDAGNPLPPVIMNPPAVRMRVNIVIHRARRFDPDNVHGGTVKILLDAMRDLQLIKNDSPRWLELHVEQSIEKDKNRERTEVELAPAENPTGGAL